MSDEIQVRSKCTAGCINGHTVWDNYGSFELTPCRICTGTGYTFRWVTFEEAGIQQLEEAT